jgi:hypothetical protein
MTKPVENVLEVPILERAQVALEEAVRKLQIDRARRGLPIHVWQDDKIVEISAKQLKAELGLRED